MMIRISLGRLYSGIRLAKLSAAVFAAGYFAVSASAVTTPPTGMIAVGPDHVVALKSDGTVWTWGSNSLGQLGIGGGPSQMAPVQVTGVSGVAAVGAGVGFSVVLKTDGTVWSWGSNFNGVLGDGTTTLRNSPVQVTGLAGVIAIATGGSHVLVVKSDGTVWAWGSNSNGKLGDGSFTSQSSPVQVSGLTQAVTVAAGASSSFALKSDGSLWAWGGNSSGQLGDGTNSSRSAPVQVTALSGIVAVATDNGYVGQGFHSIAIKSDGTVWSWGANSSGQLGDGTTTTHWTPAQITALTGTATGISASSAHTVVAMSDGTAWAFGANGSYQLGDGTTTNRTAPVQILNASAVVQVAASGTSTALLKSDGSILIVGMPASLLVGDGTTIYRLAPAQVMDLVGVVAVATNGSIHSMALRSDGTVWNWGINSNGELGDGSNLIRTKPVQASGLSGVLKIAAGSQHSLAVKSDGSVWAWGANSSGALGDGTTSSRNSPVQVAGFSGAAAVCGGSGFSIALKSDTTVWAWGSNVSGQLGDGTNTNRLSPVQIGGFTGVSAIAAGNNHTLALKSDGTVWAWGLNNGGQLGDGTTTDRNAPVQIGLAAVTMIAAGTFHGAALKSDGTVWTWGLNNSGQLGIGSTTNQTSPVQVSTLSGVIAIAAGGAHTLAIKGDGTVWVWGSNNGGELANGTLGSSIVTPVQAANLIGFPTCVPGVSNLLLLKANGSVWATGDNTSGLLGVRALLIAKAAISLVSSSVDTDQDGIADAWETQYFATLSHTGAADSDGDGLTDVQEYFLGTDPTVADVDGDLLTDIADPYPSDYYNGATPTLLIVGGNNQTAAVNQFNAQPFDIGVLTGGNLAVNAPVTFTVQSGGGQLATTNVGSPTLSTTLNLRTDAVGTVQAFYKQPGTVGVTSQINVTAGLAQLTLSTLSSSSTDSDGNGLPDAWEIAYFGHIGVSPTADPDGDGYTNLSEYLLGGNPIKGFVATPTGIVKLRVYSPRQ